MLRLALLLALLAAAQPASAQERIVPIPDFDRIVVEGPFEVQLTRGNVTRAAVTGSRQSVGAVTVEVQGQTLRIRRNPGNAWGGAPGERSAPARVTLTTRVVRSARVIGAGSLAITGMRGQVLDLALDGSGRIEAAGLEVDRLTVGLRGSGSMALVGTAARINADIQGAGSFEGQGLVVQDATVNAATTGAVALTVRRTATISASGLGEVEIAGTPACTVRGLRAGDVRCGAGR